MTEKLSDDNEFVKHAAAEKEYPVLFRNKAECCGCSACYSICPVGAISMQPDEEGFLYPQLDEKLCLHCYQCLKVCAFKRDQIEKTYSCKQ